MAGDRAEAGSSADSEKSATVKGGVLDVVVVKGRDLILREAEAEAEDVVAAVAVEDDMDTAEWR